MSSRTCTAVLAALVAVCVMTAPVVAQDTPDLDAKKMLDLVLREGYKFLPPGEYSREEIEPKQFGSLTNTLVIPLSRFVPFIPGQPYIPILAPPGATSFAPYDVSTTADSSVLLWASVDLPPGSQVTDVCILAFDTDPGTDGANSNRDVLFWFSAFETGSSIVATGTIGPPLSPDFNLIGAFGKVLSSGRTSGSMGGAVQVCDTPISGVTFPYTVRAAAVDADGDNDSGRTHYEILTLFQTPQPNASCSTCRVGFGGAYVKWQRAINTSLASAGFTDIGSLTSNFQQAINALAASGITGGCSTSPLKYCPTDNLTRAQMALFLAKAFGLYWSE